ncbi:MAG: VanZ family protein [Spirochaetales bacterium]|nr:VanZ family protein [Spirochaetales bacterium]
MNGKYLRIGAVFFWLLTIGVLSLLPGKTFEDLGYDFFGADKFVHAALYFLLAFSLIKAVPFSGKTGPALLLALAASLGWGGMMELLQAQSFIIGRSADWRDLTANLFGSLCALVPSLMKRGRVR